MWEPLRRSRVCSAFTASPFAPCFSGALSEPRVWGPAMPSATSRWARWYCVTADRVAGPNWPSTARWAPLALSSSWRARTVSPEEDCFRVGSPVTAAWAAGLIATAGAMTEVADRPTARPATRRLLIFMMGS